ncbi:MAG: mobile mystery protein B [Nitrospirae bacterium]|nr:mobile mystery protein B [Nitrospirota bacterium]
MRQPEGATPLTDVSGLLLENVATLDALNVVESANILDATREHLRRRHGSKRRWITVAYLLRVHRDMYGEVWRWAGEIRRTEKNIGIEAYRIREELEKLCGDVNFWDTQETSMPVLERGVRIHHRLAWIHAFENGNGRHARLMADIYLHAHRQPLPEWPSSNLVKVGNARRSYLEAMRAADGGNVEPLLQLTARFIKSA